jgi:hypothetical protein
MHGSATPLATHQPDPAEGLAMPVAHLAALLVAGLLLARAGRWAGRIRQLLDRLVPGVPAVFVAVPIPARLLADVPQRAPSARRRLSSNISRRGPPAAAAITALS